MGKVKIKPEIFSPIYDVPYEKNMFTDIVGDKYARMFHEIYYNELATRDERVKNIYTTAKEDETLTEDQKKLITTCCIAYNLAVGLNMPLSFPILEFINKKDTKIMKFLKSKAKFKRIVYDLEYLFDKSGFLFDINSLGIYIKVFLVQFGQRGADYMNQNDDTTYEEIVYAVFSRYARSLPYNAVSKFWYAIMFLRNLSCYSYIDAGYYKHHEHLKEQAACLINTLNNIYKTIVSKENATIDFVDMPTANPADLVSHSEITDNPEHLSEEEIGAENYKSHDDDPSMFTINDNSTTTSDIESAPVFNNVETHIFDTTQTSSTYQSM